MGEWKFRRLWKFRWGVGDPATTRMCLYLTRDRPAQSNTSLPLSALSKRSFYYRPGLQMVISCRGSSPRRLETLVLEQRPGAEELERDIDGEVCFMLNNSMGTGNRALVEMLEEVFQDVTFPSLRRVFLYGFAVGQDFALQPSKSTPG